MAIESPSNQPSVSSKEPPADVRPSRRFATRSGIELPLGVFSVESLGDWDPEKKLGEPGQYPYTRGIHAQMYRKRPWTIRHNAGYGSGGDTNALFKYLIKNGLTGLNLAVDLPTQMGLDPDDARSQFETGRVGVALSSVEDMQRIFEGIALDQVSTSTAMNGVAIVFLAQYVVAAERQGGGARVRAGLEVRGHGGVHQRQRARRRCAAGRNHGRARSFGPLEPPFVWHKKFGLASKWIGSSARSSSAPAAARCISGRN